MLDAALQTLLEGGAPYAFLVVLICIMYRPPAWSIRVLDHVIDESKERTMLLKEVKAGQAAHELADANRMAGHEKEMDVLDQTNRHDLKEAIQRAVSLIVLDSKEHREYLCERIDESMTRAVGEAVLRAGEKPK